MNCTNIIQYTIRPGDTLYLLAMYYNTTIEDIVAINMYLDPYYLQVGRIINICPNSRESQHESEKTLSDKMNMVWEQHVYWTRMLLISIAENLNDLEATKKRLLRNPKDIADIYRPYYGDAAANKIDELLTEHLVIGGDLIVALKKGETEKATMLNTKWYQNADAIAEALSSINPYYDEEEIRQMLYTHLELTTEEVKARLRKDYTADIKAFDKVEQEALRMARYFTRGIEMQFRNRF